METTEQCLLDDMQTVRNLVHLGDALRAQLDIPRSQELLDFAYGTSVPGKVVYLLPELRKLLAEALQMHDLGYNFADRLNYELDQSFEPPKPNALHDWRVIEKDGLWLALDVRIPPWLKEVYERRRAHRAEMQRRKEAGFQKDWRMAQIPT